MKMVEKYEGYLEDVRLTEIVPHKRQLEYQKIEYYGFIHFGINTYTGKEWGTGEENPSRFNPTQLDTGQWVEVAKKGGMKGLILTCKHHDGFCLWPSAYTEHSIKNSPYKNGRGDIVKELSLACRKEGLKFGVYLSPWDMNHPSYGYGEKYNNYYLSQLTELLTNYGEIFVVWLDGACGEGKNGKKQSYDWERYYDKIRELQPKACIAVSGPDIRWCGNEAGDTRSSEWSVVPKELSNPEKIASDSQKDSGKEFRERRLVEQDKDLGSRSVVALKKELIWYPAEVDVSIRPGWFYHEEDDQKVRSFENLKEIYLRSVGGNCMLLLNIPPTKEGLIHKIDKEVLVQLGDFIRNSFTYNKAKKARIISRPQIDREGNIPEVLMEEEKAYFHNPYGEREFEIEFQWEKEQVLQYFVVQEEISKSQRVEKFELYYLENNEWILYFQATTIGYKRIINLKGLNTRGVKFRITDARVCPVLSRIGIY